MKFRLLPLLAGMFMLALLIQCKDSLTQATEADSGSKIEESTDPEDTNTAVITLRAPENGATSKPFPVTFEWEPVDGVHQYRFQMAWIKTFPNPVVDKVVTGTTLEISEISDVAPDGEYYWRVRPKGDGDTKSWSAVRSFSTKQKVTGDAASTDRGALMELYEATGGDQWKSNKNWGTNAPLAEWGGIETNKEGRVTRIDLWQNNLEGKIEAVPWGALDKVKYLNLKGNHLTGAVPASLGSMAGLEVLILQGRNYEVGNTMKEPPINNWNDGYHQGKYYSNTNEFSGQIPSEIGNLSNLVALELSNAKKIVGPIPPEIGNLSNLKGLYLTGANFGGYTIPASFDNLTNLKHMYIGESGLVGELPNDFKHLTQLTALMIAGNPDTDDISRGRLTGDLPDLRQFTELRRLVLSNNEFTGQFRQYLNNGSFNHLNILMLAGNNITGTLPANLNNLDNLYAFDVERNNMTGSIDAIKDLPKKIKIISVGWNNFDGSFPQSGWPEYTQLKTITVGANPISGDIPCSFWQTIDNPKLNHVRFGEMPNIDSACLEGAKAMEGDGSLDDVTLP